MKKPKKTTAVPARPLARRVMWAFWANRSGPWTAVPVRVVRGVCDEYWDKEGDNCVKKAGVYHSDGYMYFASYDRKEVEKFIDGFEACRLMLRGFFT